MKASEKTEIQLPLKGFYAPLLGIGNLKGALVEGMGGSRYRIHTVRKSRKKA